MRIVVSGGWPTPDFTGLREDAARSLAARRRVALDVAGRREDRRAEPGTVIGQQPPAGVLLPPGQPVRVVLSADWPTPDFVGSTETQARRIAADNRVTLRSGEPREDYDRDRGRVTGQQPAAGTALPPDRTVSLVYSLGWPLAPDAIGSSARAVTQSFTARHPNARIQL